MLLISVRGLFSVFKIKVGFLPVLALCAELEVAPPDKFALHAKLSKGLSLRAGGL